MRGVLIAVAALLGASSALADSNSDSSASDAAAGKVQELQEVIVTAQKREERLIDVPLPVSVVNSQDLLDTGKVDLADYYDTVPGLIYQASAAGGYIINIRGLDQQTGAATVAIMVDGIPFGTTVGGNAFSNPDLNPSLLERVEVLKGPQGTLWGVGAMGGVVNFVTKAPSTAALSGDVRADVSAVHNGDGPNYGGSGSINVPISNTFALQLSGFARRDAGYIDNVESGDKGANWGNDAGGRLGALWQPSNDVSLRLSAMLQNSTLHGIDAINTNNDLQQAFQKGTEGTESHSQAYSAILDAKLTSSLDLTSLTGYSNSITSVLGDVNSTYGAAFGPVLGSTLGYREYLPLDDDTFSQEVHLTWHFGKVADWMLGGFFSHANSSSDAALTTNDPVTGAVVENYLSFDQRLTYQESAAFTNVTLHFTPRFDVQLGGREGFIEQTSQLIYTGPFTQVFFQKTSPYAQPKLHSNADVFTYLLAPSFKISPDLMTYARVSSGYRPGGANAIVTTNVPTQFGPDKTKNYEVGLKGDFLDHRLTLDSSVYYIDWQGIQVSESNGLIGYIANAGKAKSEGVEASLQARPFDRTTIGAWAAWNEAVVTNGFNGLFALNGQRLTEANGRGQLPPSPRWSGNVSFDQEFPLGPKVTGFAGALESYVGQRLAYLGPPVVLSVAQVSQVLPAYWKMDLHAGVRVDAWTVNLYANNVLDRRGVLNLTEDFIGYAVITPRTVGVTVSRSF